MTAEVVTASLVVVAFLVVCLALRIVEVARRINRTAGGALAAMRDPALDDDAKERAARAAAIGLLGGFWAIVWRALLALAASAALVLIADRLSLAPADAVMRRLESWPFIITATVVLTLLYVAMVVWRRVAR